MHLRQSTASQSVVIGPFVDSTDGNTAETGLTISNTDIRLSKNGANIVGKNSGGGTHDELGYYTITLDATDTNTVGRLQLMVHESGALPVYHEYEVLEEAVYDMLYAASALGYIANAPVNVAQFGGSNGTFASGRPEVNATHIGGSAISQASGVANVNVAQISGDSTAADNAEAFFDGTGYAGTNNVIPTVTDLTNKGNGSGFTAIPWNAAWDAEVQSEVQDAIEANHLDHLLAVTYDPASKPGAADALLNELVENDGGVARYTANALEQAPSGGGGSADWTADERTAIRAILGIPASGTTPDDPTTGILDTIRDAVGVVDGNVDSILVDTAEIGAAGAGLTAIPWNAAWDAEVQSEATDALNAYDPPTRAELTSDTNSVLTAVGDLPTNSELAAALAAADDAVLAAIAALNDLSAAEVNAEVVDALATDTYAEPGQGSPGATISLSAKIGYLYKAWRNRSTQTVSEYALYADDGITKDHEAAVSDDGTTLVRGEVQTGA